MEFWRFFLANPLFGVAAPAAEPVGLSVLRLATGIGLLLCGLRASRLFSPKEAGTGANTKRWHSVLATACFAGLLALALSTAPRGAALLATGAGAMAAGAFLFARKRPGRAAAAGSLAFAVAFCVTLQSLAALSEAARARNAAEPSRYPVPSEAELRRALPGADRFEERLDPAPHYEGFAATEGPEDAFAGYAFVCQLFMDAEQVEETRGYGAIVPVLLGVGADGKTAGVAALANRETPAFLMRVTAPNNLDRYRSRPLSAPFEPGVDVNAFTGATYTSRAIAAAVRHGARGFADAVLAKREALRHAESGRAGAARFSAWPDIVFLGILATGTGLLAWRRSPAVEMAVGVASVVVLGGVLQRFFSVDDALRLAMARFPARAVAAGWWATVGGTLALTLLFGRIFCRSFCPFGVLTEFLWRWTGRRKAAPRRWDRLGRRAPALVLWGAGIWFALSGMLPARHVEPFSATFTAATSLDGARSLLLGDALMLAVVAVALVGSALNRRFWCSYLCPAGAALRVLSRPRLSDAALPARCAACPRDPGEEINCPGCVKVRPAPRRAPRKPV